MPSRSGQIVRLGLIGRLRTRTRSFFRSISDFWYEQFSEGAFTKLDDDRGKRSRASSMAPGEVPLKRRTPLYAWVILVLALLAVSSAGVVLRSLEGVPSITKAAWRTQSTSLLLLIGFVVQWKWYTSNESRRRTRRSFGMISISGIALGFHFLTWIWSLDHTTLTHSLLLVTSTPIIIVIGLLILRKPVTKAEVVGTVVGCAGAVMMCAGASDSGSDSGTGGEGQDAGGPMMTVTWQGDVAAFLGATFAAVYVLVGRRLRQWMPIFVYAFPVTALSAIIMMIAAAIADDGGKYVFQWYKPEYVWKVLYLAVGPGIIGHTGLNYVLKYISPLVVTLTLTSEPLIGSVMGAFVGQVDMPHVWTWVGGSILLVGTIFVVYGNGKRETEELRKRLGENAILDDDLEIFEDPDLNTDTPSSATAGTGGNSTNKAGSSSNANGEPDQLSREIDDFLDSDDDENDVAQIDITFDSLGADDDDDLGLVDFK